MNYIFLIVVAILLGNLQIIFDIIYMGISNYYGSDIKLSLAVFYTLHPLSYMFIFFVYAYSHPNVEKTFKDKLKYFWLAPLFALLMFTWLLPYFGCLHKIFVKAGRLGSNERMRMFSMENTFWIAILNETIIYTLPVFIT